MGEVEGAYPTLLLIKKILKKKLKLSHAFTNFKKKNKKFYKKLR